MTTLQVTLEAIVPENRRGIRALGSSLKQSQQTQADLASLMTYQWLSGLRELVDSIHTGRRKGEITLFKKKSYLRSISKISDITSPKRRISNGIGLLTKIMTDISEAECKWKPRGKLIPSGRLLEGKEELTRILIDARNGPIQICDPWVSSKTLDILRNVPPKITINVVSVNVKDKDKFLQNLEEIRNSGRKINIYILDRKGGSLPHDRYLILSQKGFMVGCSIDQIGKKDSMIHELDNPQEVEGLINEYINGDKGKVLEIL
ncbi:MAG: hypothetical protein ACTSPB_03980 [Candidatus Thorarchaeota archaeon]